MPENFWKDHGGNVLLLGAGGASLAMSVYLTQKKFGDNVINTIEVAFPIMHGTNGEDGTIQGYLELLGLPYIGCDIVSSATSEVR